jgi:hypothetical protein
MTDPTPLRKISAKNVYGRIPPPPEKGHKPLFQVIGQATGIRETEKDFGDGPRASIGLVGTFEAVNLETMEIFQAPECFLPEPFASAIGNQFKGEGERPVAVDFALEIGIKAPSEGQNVRYVYTSKPISDPTQGDPLKELRKRLPALAPPSENGGEKAVTKGGGGSKK